MQTKTPGIVLIAIGLVMMIYTGFNYVTTENVMDLGPLQVNKNENHQVHWPPIIGALLLSGGIVLLVINKNKS